MSKLDDKIKSLTGDKTDKLNKSTEISLKSKEPIKRGKNGGSRPGAGRPASEELITRRGIKAYLMKHYDENVTIRITDPKTGQVRDIPKPRAVIVIEHLFAIGVGQTEKGSADALDKWLNRAIGRPAQPIVGGDEGDEPIKTEIVGLETILDKAYPDGDDND